MSPGNCSSPVTSSGPFHGFKPRMSVMVTSRIAAPSSVAGEVKSDSGTPKNENRICAWPQKTGYPRSAKIDSLEQERVAEASQLPAGRAGPKKRGLRAEKKSGELEPTERSRVRDPAVVCVIASPHFPRSAQEPLSLGKSWPQRNLYCSNPLMNVKHLEWDLVGFCGAVRPLAESKFVERREPENRARQRCNLNGSVKLAVTRRGMVQKGGQAPRQDALFQALAVDSLGAGPRF
jgi:hypothetical protein